MLLKTVTIFPYTAMSEHYYVSVKTVGQEHDSSVFSGSLNLCRKLCKAYIELGYLFSQANGGPTLDEPVHEPTGVIPAIRELYYRAERLNKELTAHFIEQSRSILAGNIASITQAFANGNSNVFLNATEGGPTIKQLAEMVVMCDKLMTDLDRLSTVQPQSK